VQSFLFKETTGSLDGVLNLYKQNTSQSYKRYNQVSYCAVIVLVIMFMGSCLSLQGSECCSQLSISFHRMTTRDMLVFDHLLYKTSVHGRHSSGAMPNFFKYSVMKKLPNGIPTMRPMKPN